MNKKQLLLFIKLPLTCSPTQLLSHSAASTDCTTQRHCAVSYDSSESTLLWALLLINCFVEAKLASEGDTPVLKGKDGKVQTLGEVAPYGNAAPE